MRRLLLLIIMYLMMDVNLLTATVGSGVLSIEGTPDVSYPVDVTDLITNSDFSDGTINGWDITITDVTNKGYMGTTYTNEKENVVINQFIECWRMNNVALGNGEISQCLETLPAGKYKFSADIIATSQSGDVSKGVYLFVRENENIVQRSVFSSNGIPEHYELTFISSGNDVTIGVRTENTTVNWLAVDNFNLQYYGAYTEVPVDDDFTFELGKDYYLYNEETQKFFAAGNDYDTRASLEDEGVPIRIHNANKYLMSSEYPNAYIIQNYVPSKGGWFELFCDEEGDIWIDRVSQKDYIWSVTQNTDSTIRISCSVFNPIMNSETLGDCYIGWDMSNTENSRLYFFSPDDVKNVVDWKLLTSEQYEKMQLERHLQSIVLPEGWENANDDAPVNFTSLIVNPEFDNNDLTGWSGTQYGELNGNENAEHYNKNYDTFQTLIGLPAGMYRVNLKAFYRAGLAASDAEYYFNGENNGYNPSDYQLAKLYAESDKFNEELSICMASSGANAEMLGGSESSINNKNGETLYIPNDMVSGALYFSAGKYNNGVYVEVGDKQKLTIGIRKFNTIDGDWTLVDGWTLMYYGKNSHHYSGEDAVNELNLSEAYRMFMEAKQKALELSDTLDAKLAPFGMEIKEVLSLYSNYSPIHTSEEDLLSATYVIDSVVVDVKERIPRAVCAYETFEENVNSANVLLRNSHYSGYSIYESAILDIIRRETSEECPVITDTDDYVAFYKELSDKLDEAKILYVESANVAFTEEQVMLDQILVAVPSKQTEIKDSHIISVDISENDLTEFPYALLNMPYVRSINASDNKIAHFLPMKNFLEEPFDGEINLRNQKIENVIDLSFEKLTDSLETLVGELPSLIFYDHEKDELFTKPVLLYLSTTDTEMDEGWGVFLMYDGNYRFFFNNEGLENNVYYGQSGDVLSCTNQNGDEWTSGCSFLVRLTFQQGDANFIEGVNVADLQATINYIFGGYRDLPFNFTAADTYADGVLNVQDVICTVNILLAQNAVETVVARRMNPYNNRISEKADAYLSIRDGQLVIQNEVPVAALDIKLIGNGDVAWNFDKLGLLSVEERKHVVAYSLSNVTIPCGETVLAEIKGDLSINTASLADSDARSMKVGLNTTTTNVEGVFSDNEEAEYFSISGVRFKKPQGTINIVRKNGKTYKQINNNTIK